MPLLEVTDLKTHFQTDDGIVKAVDGVSFSVEKGQTLGIVGESGCGKSVTCLTIMGLNPKKSSIISGQAMFNGEDLLKVKQKRLREIRGNEIAMIFQDPMTSLNPVHTIGKQLVEAVMLHNDMSKRQAKGRVIEGLKAVGIPHAERRFDDYPHQFSGGMRQRVMIAMALLNSPDLLIADEPTTALDVTTQAQILKLMNDLRERFGSAIIMITHDLGVVAETADDVVVMYAGKIQEQAPVDLGVRASLSIRTPGVCSARFPGSTRTVERLAQIPGQPPSLLRPPSGCKFHPRCAYTMDVCRTTEPELLPAESHPDHRFRCWLDQATRDQEGSRVRQSKFAEVAGLVTASVPTAIEETAASNGNELLVVEDLKKHFPVTRGIVFQKQIAAVKAVDGAQPHRPTGRDARGCRRVRAAASRRWPAASCGCSIRRAARSSSRAATSRRSRVPRCGRSAAT